jgi:hypothetical protein
MTTAQNDRRSPFGLAIEAGTLGPRGNTPMHQAVRAGKTAAKHHDEINRRP